MENEPLGGDEDEFFKVLLDVETLSEILTTEFIYKGIIPGNARLEIKEMETDDDLLGLTLLIHEDYIN